jgi:hypothetical protein
MRWDWRRIMAAKELEDAVRQFRQAPRKGVDTTPDSPFEALLELRMKALERQVEEVKGRVNGLLFAVIGAIVIQLILGILR